MVYGNIDCGVLLGEKKMVHKKDLVTRLKDIWDEEIQNNALIMRKKEVSFQELYNSHIALFKSHTELLKDILDLKILPSEPVLSLNDPLMKDQYDQDGVYMYTINTTSHYSLNQKIKKELKLDDYYL